MTEDDPKLESVLVLHPTEFTANPANGGSVQRPFLKCKVAMMFTILPKWQSLASICTLTSYPSPLSSMKGRRNQSTGLKT